MLLLVGRAHVQETVTVVLAGVLVPLLVPHVSVVGDDLLALANLEAVGKSDVCGCEPAPGGFKFEISITEETLFRGFEPTEKDGLHALRFLDDTVHELQVVERSLLQALGRQDTSQFVAQGLDELRVAGQVDQNRLEEVARGVNGNE